MLGEMNPNRFNPGRVQLRGQGLTLIELMVTVAITAVLVAVAVPSMQQMIAKRRVAGVANELAIDLRYLRSLSVLNGVMTQLDFGSNPASTCYMLSTDLFASFQPCDCTDPTSCQSGPIAVKTVSLQRSDGVTVTQEVTNLPLRFLGPSAMPEMLFSAATIRATVSSSRGGSVRVWTNTIGRAFTCSVSGQESNFPACP